MDKLGQDWVSAVVDGEAEEHELTALFNNKESHQQWRDYHLIGDAMRGELPESLDLDLSDNIAAAIELEPTIIAPSMVRSGRERVAIDTINDKDLDRTQEQTASNGKLGQIIPLFKQFGQYAIAASVALVAVVGVQNYQQPEQLDSAPLPVLDTRPVIGSVSPVSLQTGVVQKSSGYDNQQVFEQRQRINAYIQDHMLQQRLNNEVNTDNQDAIKAPALSQQ